MFVVPLMLSFWIRDYNQRTSYPVWDLVANFTIDLSYNFSFTACTIAYTIVFVIQITYHNLNVYFSEFGSKNGIKTEDIEYYPLPFRGSLSFLNFMCFFLGGGGEESLKSKNLLKNLAKESHFNEKI